MKKNVLITTSIAYVNGAPHVGFAMESIEADAYARWHRSRGNNVYFLTGTDEHGSKIYQAAKKQGITAQELADSNSEKFKQLEKKLNISIDDFIRTSEERHKKGAQEFWKRIEQSGKFELRDFEGKYCVGCETFLTDKELTADGKCPNHLIEPEIIHEKNVFFKLSEYTDLIIDLLENNKIQILPEFRKNELVTLAKEEGLKDVSFSRTKNMLPWGIPVPEDDEQVMYVWCDALTNYITALGFGSNDNWRKFWEAGEVIHFIGKDILRFHAGIWPAMLKSANLPQPTKICVHGFLTSEGHKMSKSIGNVVDPFAVINEFEGNPDPLRYFLLAEVPFGRDADFTRQRFEEIYNSKLANGLGNLFSRILTLAEKAGKVAPATQIANPELAKIVDDLSAAIDSKMERCELHTAIAEIFAVVEFLNLDIDRVKPWVSMKADKNSASTEIADWLAALNKIAEEIIPFLPGTGERMLAALDSREKTTLFPRIDKKAAGKS